MGGDAFASGELESDNYFPEGHEMRDAWLEGWTDAEEYENECEEVE